MRSFVRSSIFENVMTLAVTINTLSLMIDHNGIDEETSNTLSQMNFIFTMIFIGELAIKIIGLGPITYIQDKMNYLDGGVVILSIIELTVM